MDNNLKSALGLLVAACEQNKSDNTLNREMLVAAREHISDALYEKPAHNLYTKE